MIIGMTIAFDYDETYTADPEAMGAAMRALMDHGHTVIVITARGDHRKPRAEDVIRADFGEEVPVIRSHKTPKTEAARTAGYDVDVWVDDCPWKVLEPERRA